MSKINEGNINFYGLYKLVKFLSITMAIDSHYCKPAQSSYVIGHL